MSLTGNDLPPLNLKGIMTDKQKGGKKNRKLGRDVAKCLSYKMSHRREANKIKRMMRSNGLAYTEAWAAERGVSGMVAKALRV